MHSFHPVTVYHNPACGTSRNVLCLLRAAGIEPTVIEYLQTPPDRATLVELIGRMGVPVRALLRDKGTPYAELGLQDPSIPDEVLMDRPIVVTPAAVRLCRPSESVLELLTPRQLSVG
jgi:arsenate reductase (glutaredoxin)